MKKFLISIVLLFVFGSTMAQQRYTVSGIVRDKSSGETLIGVAVYLEGSNYGVITNEYGFYSLTVPAGDYTLKTQYLSYKESKQAIDLRNNFLLDIEMEEEASVLNEVVVVDKKKGEIDIQTPQMGVHTLNSDQMKRIPVALGEADLIRSLSLLPGVSRGGEGSTGFHVRGGAADQNLVLLDEAIIYNGDHLFGFLSVFNNDAIKKAKLYRGGIPAKYGGRISSVLDVVQKDGNLKKFQINGGISSIVSRITLQGPIKKNKTSFLFSARTAYVGLFLALANSNARIGFYDLNVKINHQIDRKNKVFLSGYFGRDNFKLSKNFKNNYGNTSFNLRWNHIYSEKVFSNLSLIYSNYYYNLNLDFIGMDWESSITNFNLKYDWNIYFNNNFIANVGISALHYKFSPGTIEPSNERSRVARETFPKKRALESSVYFDLDHQVNERLTLRYGIRYSLFLRMGPESLNLYSNDQPLFHNRLLTIYQRSNSIGTRKYGKNEVMKNFSNFEPRISLSYKLSNTNSIKFSYQRMIQYIHLISNTNSPSPLDIWVPSGKYIDPQIGDQYSIGWFKNIADGRYSLETEAYYKSVENRLDYIDGADIVANKSIEREVLSGEANSHGWELLFKKNTGKITGMLGYTYSQSQQRTTGIGDNEVGISNGNWYYTPYDRTHDLAVVGSYLINDKLNLNLNFVYQTGRPVNYPNGQFFYGGVNYPVYGSRNNARLPAYHRLDISLILIPRKNKTRKLKTEWVFGIYNIYDRRNAASITFNENKAEKVSIFGITPSITYNFKF